MSYPPTAPYAPYPPGRAPRRRHPLRITVIILVLLIGLLVAADFGAKALAEQVMADQIKSHGFPKKPDVTIQGFPFLTQVAARDLHTVDISSADVKEGPLTITSIKAALDGVHIDSSFHGGTVDRLAGTVFISFPAISSALAQQAGPLGSALGNAGMTLQPAGAHSVKATVNVLVTSFSVTWRISVLPGNKISARLTSSSGVPGSLLGSIGNITVPLPKLPLGLRVTRLSVTPRGLTGDLGGHNLSFSG